MYRLNPETEHDWWEVEALFDLAFAPGREALSSYRLRDGVDAIEELCLVARDVDAVLAGAVRFWPVQIGGAKALLLGPIAVHPTRHGEGLGGALIRDGLAGAKAAGWERVMLVGDAQYYGRLGFQLLKNVTMPPPTNPDRVLGCPLISGAWDGISGDVSAYTCG